MEERRWREHGMGNSAGKEERGTGGDAQVRW